MSLKKYMSSITKNQETSGDDKFMKPPPDKTIGMKNGQYDKLNEKGYIPEETRITNGDVIFGKVTPITDMAGSDKIFRDSSEQYKSHADGVVDRVHTNIKNQDGYETRKALVRSERTPHIGDKFCLRLDQDVDVMTSKGWISLKDITKKDLVATLVNDHCEYHHPIGCYSFNYDGYIVQIRSDNVDLDVTCDHELFVKLGGHNNYDLIRADKLLNMSVTFKCNARDINGNMLFDNVNNENIVDMEKNHTTYNYKGMVGCIEVPSHVFMIRQNNKNVWIGNCSRHGQTISSSEIMSVTGGNGFARIRRTTNSVEW